MGGTNLMNVPIYQYQVCAPEANSYGTITKVDISSKLT